MMQNENIGPSEMTVKNANLLVRFFHYTKEEIKSDFRHSNIVGIPFFLLRGVEVNYFFIIPAVSTLAILMLIFVPLHRYPTEWIINISAILIVFSNIASLIAVMLWRFFIERHYQDMVEKRREMSMSKSLVLNTAARFASPFLTPEGSHPVRHVLGLWVKDNLLYILPAVILVALFPSDILMLDPVMEEGVSSIFTYIILFTVMANLVMFCSFALFFTVRWIFIFIRKITRTLSGASYLDQK